MEIETILKLYLPIVDLPVSGTFQQENLLLDENESIRRIFVMEFLETKGYTLKPAETKTLASINWKVKHYWFTAISIRWKDFGNEEVNAFEHIVFEDYFKENSEFHGYHTGNKFAL
jgi:hypothetical protein